MLKAKKKEAKRQRKLEKKGEDEQGDETSFDAAGIEVPGGAAQAADGADAQEKSEG